MEKPHKYATIGKRIQTIRSEKGMSQAKFAVNIGISQRFLSDLETGRIKPSIPILLAIEYVYKYRKEWILTGNEPAHVRVGEPPLIVYPPNEEALRDKQFMVWSKILARIFKEGDKAKIEAIKAQLRAFDPGEKKQGMGDSEDAGTESKSNIA
jgi:transcriptional regulator with XRE-family HTH domain